MSRTTAPSKPCRRAHNHNTCISTLAAQVHGLQGHTGQQAARSTSRPHVAPSRQSNYDILTQWASLMKGNPLLIPLSDTPCSRHTAPQAPRHAQRPEPHTSRNPTPYTRHITHQGEA